MIDNTNAERQRRYINKLKAAAAGVNNAAPEARVRELEQENAKLKAAGAVNNGAAEARMRELEEVNMALRKRCARAELRAEAKAAKPAAAAPAAAALDPDPYSAAAAEIAKLRTQIKGLQTRVHNLRVDIRIMLLDRDELRQAGKMPLGTYSAVVKCLHPDTRATMTPQQIDVACGKLTAWKKSQDKA
jgi:hypothetical protein